MPDDLAIRRVQKRNPKSPVVEWTAFQAFAIPFSLRQDTLWAERQFLRFDDAYDRAIDAQSISAGPFAVSNSPMAYAPWFGSGFSVENGTTFQPAAFSLGSMSLLRLSHSDSFGDRLYSHGTCAGTRSSSLYGFIGFTKTARSALKIFI